MYMHFTYFKTQCKSYLLFILSMNIPSLFPTPRSVKIKWDIMVAADSALDFLCNLKKKKKIFNIYILYLQNESLRLLLLENKQ